MDPSYIIEKPKEGVKGKCLVCKLLFPDDEIRLGYRETDATIQKGPWKWNHITCVPIDRWDTAEEVYGDVTEIPGVAATEGAAARVGMAHSNARASADHHAKKTADETIAQHAAKEEEASRKQAEKAKAKADKAAAKNAEKASKAAAKEAEKAAKTAGDGAAKTLDFGTLDDFEPADSRIKGKCIVVIGSIADRIKTDVKAAITAAGGHFRGNISKLTEFIVLGSCKEDQLEKAEASAAEKGIETMTGEELVKEFEAAGVTHVRAVQTAVRTLEDEEDAGVTRGGKKRRTSLAAA